MEYLSYMYIVQDDDKEKVVPTPGVPTPKDSTALPTDHEDAHKWFYKDPQGDMQGTISL